MAVVVMEKRLAGDRDGRSGDFRASVDLQTFAN